jgi:hypothetical protein
LAESLGRQARAIKTFMLGRNLHRRELSL